MSRLHRPRPEDLAEPQRRVYDDIVGGQRGGAGAVELVDAQGRLNGPWNAMVVAPNVGGALGRLGSALRFEGLLPARAREIVILAVASAKQSAFELFAHTKLALPAGLTSEEIAELVEGRSPRSLDRAETAALDLARQLVEDRAVSDEEFERFRDHLGEADIVEIATLVGYYAMLAMQLSLFGVLAPGEGTLS